MSQKNKIFSTLEKEFKNIILKEAIKTFPVIRERNYQHSYYLANFMHMLNDAVRWEALRNFNTYRSSYEFHYKVIAREYVKWSNQGVFFRARKEFFNRYYYELYPEMKKIRIVLYIDGSYFANKWGIDFIGINPELKKKKVSKIIALVDNYKNLISIMYIESEQSWHDLNGKIIKKKTFCHDVKCIQTAIDNIVIELNNRKNLYIVGDKAFITSQKFVYKNKTIIIVTPKKSKSSKTIKNKISKNEEKLNLLECKLELAVMQNKRKKGLITQIDKIKNKINELKGSIDVTFSYNKKEKTLLGKRYVVENKFAILKKYERLTVRKDHLISTFMSFIYIADLIWMNDKLDKKNVII